MLDLRSVDCTADKFKVLFLVQLFEHLFHLDRHPRVVVVVVRVEHVRDLQIGLLFQELADLFRFSGVNQKAARVVLSANKVRIIILKDRNWNDLQQRFGDLLHAAKEVSEWQVVASAC